MLATLELLKAAAEVLYYLVAPATFIVASLGAKRSKRNTTKLQEIKLTINGRLDNLLAHATKEGFRQGVEHEQSKTKDGKDS